MTVYHVVSPSTWTYENQHAQIVVLVLKVTSPFSAEYPALSLF